MLITRFVFMTIDLKVTVALHEGLMLLRPRINSI
jgi:hypothetical protein